MEKKTIDIEKKGYNDTSDIEEQIELRSSNTRQFIREDPSFTIRYGTVIIVLILILVSLAVILYFQKTDISLNLNKLL